MIHTTGFLPASTFQTSLQPTIYKTQATAPNAAAATPPATLATAAAPVYCTGIVVAEGPPVVFEPPVEPPAEPPVERADDVTLNALEGKKPLQIPLLHVLYAHCASFWHAALKFPHLAISPALLAQHCTPCWHWLRLASALHSAPSGSEPAGAVTVEGGAGL